MKRMVKTLPALVDDFEGHLARKGRSLRTRESYRWTLWKFLEANRGLEPELVDRDVCERFLNRWVDRAPATMAQRAAALATFTAYLVDRDVLQTDPMAKVARPKRHAPEKLDVVTVSSEDVRRMFDAVRSWPEALALSLVVYTGARRGAAAGLRWRDVDLVNGEARFRWKGGTIHTAMLPAELVELFVLYSSERLELEPDDYVIPNLQPDKVRLAERDDRIVWNLVRAVAERAGVRATVHALRAAFAVVCLDELGLDPIALKDAMGHERIETTMVYLRRRDRRRSLERVKALTWSGLGALALAASTVEAHTGFEPVLEANDDGDPSRRKGIIEDGGFQAMLARLQDPARELEAVD